MQKKEPDFYDVFIIDDGSNDNSFSIVKNFINKNNLKNFFLIKKNNGNWGSVINYVKNNNSLKSKYVTILDADDFYNEKCFDVIEKLMNKNYDLIFTGFNEIKGKKITKGYLIPFKGNQLLNKKYMRFPSLIPLCKFFKTEIFLKLNDLKENSSYQDIILWNKFIDLSSTFYYVKKEYGNYLNHREGASSTQPFDKKRIETLVDIINKLVSDDLYLNGYLMALLMHIKKNSSKHDYKYIKVKNKKGIKKFKLLWCPLGTRIIVKVSMKIYLNQILS